MLCENSGVRCELMRYSPCVLAFCEWFTRAKASGTSVPEGRAMEAENFAKGTASQLQSVYNLKMFMRGRYVHVASMLFHPALHGWFETAW